jgi:hypothetical protein
MLRSGEIDREREGPVDWISLVVLAIIWAALLLPAPKRKRETRGPFTPRREMDHEEFSHPGRWILSPKRSARFVGPGARARMRARERRRRVIVFLAEAIGITLLMGLFPPLRPMLYVSGFLFVLFLVFLAASLRVAMLERSGAPARPRPRPAPVYERSLIVLPKAVPQDDEVRSVRVAAR